MRKAAKKIGVRLEENATPYDCSITITGIYAVLRALDSGPPSVLAAFVGAAAGSSAVALLEIAVRPLFSTVE
jgi:hypothetical protein